MRGDLQEGSLLVLKAEKIGLKTQKLVQNCEKQTDQGYFPVKIDLLHVS